MAYTVRRPVILVPVQSSSARRAEGAASIRFVEAARAALGVAMLFAFTGALSGCQQCSPSAAQKPSGQTPAPAASAPPRASAVPSVIPQAKPAPLGERIPVGPRQIVLPGHGITAIRFGATVETIERHMQAPCDVKTETRCLYVKQAIDFTLDKGVLVRAKVHLRDRLVPGYPERAFGTFYGGMQPDILLGLHRHIVHEELGNPESSEQVSSGDKLGLVARDFYPGVTLEFDKIDNGNIVLAAMDVFPADVPMDAVPGKKKGATPVPAGAGAKKTAPPPATSAAPAGSK